MKKVVLSVLIFSLIAGVVFARWGVDPSFIPIDEEPNKERDSFDGEGIIQAIEKYEERCKGFNDGKACYKVGRAWFYGKTGRVDYKRAFKYLKMSCELGYGGGCYLLGVMYKKGYGMEKNEDKALELYKKGCDLGYKDACKYVN
ncbi:MAG: sel1 repeat family protein [Thermodesulfobacterium sp.]|nr:sel1 repeat family protein [Thermodesulfobacterium sp.]